MRKFLSSLLAIMFLISGLHTVKVSADEGNIDDQQLYNQAVQEGVLKKERVSFEKWKEENKELKKLYDEGRTKGVLDESISYAEWIKANNYGQFEYEEVKTRKPRAVVDGFNIQKGDILITNGTSSAGIAGHAAIANGNNHILDAPGFLNYTRQMTMQKWINEYKKDGWVKVYRLSDSNLAQQAASWADRTFYSSTGSSVQDKFIPYFINHYLYSISPTYCSKLVFQSFYYGTGSAKVMKAKSGFLPPFSLIDAFQMKPMLVKTYN
ncbi:hypothetical protein [Bacillus sp. FSL K6-0067]|uniref:hypothetical protein n=1 Tax=Bacillus sp. FSL K6-0067 TaxID=2921412 RepID=UPI00077ACABC|nr:hypothetical protein [Bacillus cereus]KXY10992.1 hypothetical protein AT267_00915 [Bacillus cereus]